MLFLNSAANTDATVNIAVHEGVFHADDVVSVALAVTQFSKVNVSRVLNIENESAYDCIIDVGGKYDDGVNAYDCIIDIGGKYDDGVKACGLTLFAQAILPPELSIELYNRAFKAIAIQDNGQTELMDDNPNLMFGWVHAMNPTWDKSTKTETDNAFRVAVNLAVTIVKSLISRIEADAKAQDIWNNANRINEKIVVLPLYIPWKKRACDEPEILFVIHPSNRGGYTLNAAPVSMDDLDNQKHPLNWAERPNGCEFIHKNKFCSSFVTEEYAIKAALALC